MSAGAARRILPFLSCMGKRIKEGSDRGSEVWIVHSGRAGKGPVLCGNRRNLADEEIVRKITFPGSIAGVPYLCNEWGQWAGNMDEGKCCSGLWASESASS